MSDTDKTGGPAYPFHPTTQPENQDGTWNQGWEPSEPGMTLLDAFAMAAERGILASLVWWPGIRRDAQRDERAEAIDAQIMRQVAELAYGQAAAMLAEKHRRETDHG